MQDKCIKCNHELESHKGNICNVSNCNCKPDSKWTNTPKNYAKNITNEPKSPEPKWTNTPKNYIK